MRVDLREFSSELYQIASGCVRKEYVGQMVVNHVGLSSYSNSMLYLYSGLLL